MTPTTTNQFHKSTTPNNNFRNKSHTNNSENFYTQNAGSMSMSIINAPRPLRHASQGGSQQNTPTKFKQAGASIKRSFTEVMQKIKDITSDKIKPRISGKFNYRFRLQVEGTSIFQAGYLMAQAFSQSKEHQEIAIPTKCKWYRLIRQRKYQVPCVGGNIYQLSADDIGAKIQVKVDPLEDQEFSGSAFAQYGPISLTSMAKKRLEDIIAAGSCKFAVNVKQIYKRQKVLHSERQNNSHLEREDTRNNRTNNDSFATSFSNFAFSSNGSPDFNGDEGSLMIQSSELKLSFYESKSTENTILKTGLAVQNPKIKINLNDMTRFKLLFPDTRKIIDGDIKAYITMDIKAISAQMRDLIILTLRCFMLHSHLSNTKQLRQITSIFSEKQAILTHISQNGGYYKKASDDGRGEDLIRRYFKNKGCLSMLLLQAEASQRELYQLVDQNVKLEAEKCKMQKILHDMEEEIQFTVRSYNSILSQKASCSILSPPMLKKSAQSDHTQNNSNNLFRQDDSTVNNAAVRQKQLQQDKQYEINALRSQCTRIQQMKSIAQRTLLQKDTTIASLRDQLVTLKNRQNDQLSIVQENNTLRIKIHQLSESKTKAQKELKQKDTELIDKDRYNNEKIKVIQQNYIQKELEMLGKIDHLKSEKKKLKNDLQQIKNKQKEQLQQQQSILMNQQWNNSEILPIEKQMSTSTMIFDNEIQRELETVKEALAEAEKKNEGLLIQRNQLQKKKESLAKDIERKQEEFTNIHANYQGQIDEFRQKLNEKDEIIDKNKVLEAEKKELEKKIDQLSDALTLQIQCEQKTVSEVADTAQNEAKLQLLEMQNESLKTEVDKLAAKLSRAEAAARRAQR